MSQLTDSLFNQFIEQAKAICGEIEPIRVLKARAYQLGNANVLVRAAADTGKRYFFGLNYIHAEEIANFSNPYFAFICGSLDRTLLIPAKIILDNASNISHDRNGEYKICFDSAFNLILSGRGNRLDCTPCINNWAAFTGDNRNSASPDSAEQSYHTVLQGRLLEIGKIRGYQTFCPNKSKRFNSIPLGEIATLNKCPELQFSDIDLLRQIDVLWFKEKGTNLIPECGFEVEISTGTWSGVGRLSTLMDYSGTRLYVISNDFRKYSQVMNSFHEISHRFRHVMTEDLGQLYSAERNLRDLRFRVDL